MADNPVKHMQEVNLKYEEESQRSTSTAPETCQELADAEAAQAHAAHKQEQLDMTEAAGDKSTRRRRPPMVLFIIIPLFFGLLGLLRVTQSPQFESYRTIDVAQLLVSGAGLGAGRVGFLFGFLRPHTKSNKTHGR
jgi:hypothetical protein